MTEQAKQFDGTLGSAKLICAWIDDPTKANAGPSYLEDDAGPGGLDLIGVDANGAPLYTTAYTSNWVVRSGDVYVVFSHEQYVAAQGLGAS